MSLTLAPVASASLYQPGQTLEPDCAPGSANCGVVAFPRALGTSTPIGTSLLTIQATDTASILATLRAFAGQSANILQVQNSGGSNLFTIDNQGIVTLSNDLNVSGSGQFNSDLVADGSGVGFSVTNDAQVSGNFSVDGLTTLSNLSAGTSTVTGNFITPMATNFTATGSQNNVNFGVGSLFQFTGTGDVTVTGIAGGSDGRFIRIMNNSASNLTFTNEDGASAADNRIRTPSGANVVVGPQVSIGLQYDISGLHWHVVVLPATSATVSSFAFVQGGNSFGGAANLGTADASAMSFMTSGLTRFTLATSSATLTGNGATSLTTSGGSDLNLVTGSTGALTLDSGTTGAINIGTGGGAKIITIGTTTGATALNLKSGSGGVNITGTTSLQDFTAANATTTNLVVSTNSKLGTIISGIWNGSAVGATFGGTGQTGYAAGDILYANSTTTLTRLTVGSIGTVLKVSVSGVPTWGTDLTSSGGETLIFATSSDDSFVYMSDPGHVLALGSTATATTDGSILQVTGSGYLTGGLSAASLNATSATVTASLHAGTISGDGQNITLARLGSSTFSTLQDLQNVFHSAGWTSGGTITNLLDGSHVSVAAGTGLFRPTNSSLSTVFYGDWSASSTITIATNTIRYIGVEYNGGTPRVTSRTTASWDYKTDWPLGVVANENGTIHVGNDVQGVGDHAATMIQREYETMPLERDERDGGLMLSESGDGSRNVSLTAGALWDRLTRYPIPATTTFDTYTGTTLQASAQTQWDNLNYDNGGALTALDPNKYAALWFYVETDGGFVMVYGTAQYASLAAAVAEEEPMDLPLRVTANGKLVGRLLFRKSAATAAEVDTAFNMNQFTSTALTFLSNLQGLDYANSGLTGFVASGGVFGGQAVIGGTSTTDGLTLQSTAGTGTTDFIKFLVGTNGATEAGRFNNAGNFSVPGLSTLGSLSVTGTSTLGNFTAGNATTTGLSVSGLSLLSGGLTSSATSTINAVLNLSGALNASSTLGVTGAASFNSTGLFNGGLTLAGAGTGLSVTNNGTIGGTLGVTGLATLGNLSVTGTSTLQNFTAGIATTSNLIVSTSSTLGTVISGIWNGSTVGFAYGGTDQTSWTKGDILYASNGNVLSKLPIGSAGTVLTTSVSGLPVWAAAGGGGSGSDHWATSSNDLIVHPADPGLIVVIGGSATTAAGTILEVTGNSLFTGSATTTGTLGIGGNVAVNGGSLTTTQTTANLFNTTATTLNIGGAATTIGLGAAGATVTGGGALTLKSGSATALALDSGTTGAIDIGTSSNAKVITIGNGTGATSLVLNAGTGNIDIGANAFARAVNLGTGAAAQAVTVGSTNGASSLAFNSGTGSQTHTSSVVSGTGSASAFVFNASSLSSGTALRLTSAGTSGLLFDQNLTNTSGTVDKMAYGAATSLTGATTGLSMDLSTNVTATGIGVTGVSVSTPGDTNINTAAKKGLTIISGAITENTGGATGLYVGGDVTMPALTLTSGTALNAHGLRVTTGNVTQSAGTLTENGLLVDQSGSSITTGGTINGLNVVAAGVGVGTLNGLKIGNITGGGGTETALNIGSGWDTDLTFVSTAPKIAMGNTGTLQVTDGTNVLASIIDQGTYGTLKLSDKGSTGDPGTCTTGEMYFNATDRVFKGCTAANTWTSLSQTDNVKITSETSSDALSTSNTDIGIAVTITPRSATSEVLLNGYVDYIGNSTANTNVTIQVRRGTLVSGTLVVTTICGTTDSHDSVCAWTAVDNPGTTSAQTYTVWARGNAANGNMTNKANMAMEVNQGADIAELYGTNDESLAMGDVVSLDPTLGSGVTKSGRAYDPGAVGVVSTQPGVLMGSGDRAGAKSVPVALAGRVPVKISDENGPIKAGDYLTTSATPGLAAKATHAGPIIGQALTDAAPSSGPGIVTMFVKNAFYDGSSLSGTATSTASYGIGLVPVLLGDVTPALNGDGTDNGLTALIADIQSEAARNPVAIISESLSNGKQVLSDFVAARVTAIRGYFDEVFTKKVHTEQICLKRTDGTEVCVNGDQVDTLLRSGNVTPQAAAAAEPPSREPERAPAPGAAGPEATTTPESAPLGEQTSAPAETAAPAATEPSPDQTKPTEQAPAQGAPAATEPPAEVPAAAAPPNSPVSEPAAQTASPAPDQPNP